MLVRPTTYYASHSCFFLVALTHTSTLENESLKCNLMRLNELIRFKENCFLCLELVVFYSIGLKISVLTCLMNILYQVYILLLLHFEICYVLSLWMRGIISASNEYDITFRCVIKLNVKVAALKFFSRYKFQDTEFNRRNIKSPGCTPTFCIYAHSWFIYCTVW